jgi:hypothetical protein
MMLNIILGKENFLNAFRFVEHPAVSSKGVKGFLLGGLTMKKYLWGVMAVLVVCGLLIIGCPGDDGGGIQADVTGMTLTAETNHPAGSMFGQNSTGDDYIEFTIGGIDTSIPGDFKVNYKIADIFGNPYKEGSIDCNAGAGAVQKKRITIDKTKPGYFSVTGSIEGGASLRNDVRGSRPRTFLPYAVVPEVEKRRKNNYYVPNAAELKAMKGPVKDVDKYMYWGMAFVPLYVYDGVADPLSWLGINVSISGELRWSGAFWADTGTNTQKLAEYADPDTEYMNEWSHEVEPAASSLKMRLHFIAEMTAYMPKETRTAGGQNGEYGGVLLEPYGALELERYVEGLAKIHINQGAHRPLHYYQVLWEPVDWWGAWLPAGDVGDTGLVRMYELAYNAIHKVYNDKAAETGDDSWKARAVVLGPTYSGASNFIREQGWHKRMFEKGLANFIDGFSVHPYNDFGNYGVSSDSPDNKFADTVKMMVDMTNQYYTTRTTHKYFDKPFFWGTEQGLKQDSRNNTPVRMAQVLTRQNLTMMGEGFHSNQVFGFADGASSGGYGCFYNCTTMRAPLDIFSPPEVAPKEMAAAYAAASWLLTGYETAGRVNPGPANTWGYKFQDTESNDVIYAVWKYSNNLQSAGSSQVTLAVDPGEITVYDVVGNIVKTGGNGSVDLTLTEWAQYVKVKK